MLLLHSVMGSPQPTGLEIAVGEKFAELCPSRLGYAENAQPAFPPKQACDFPSQGSFDGTTRSPIAPYLVEERGKFLQVLARENRGGHKGLMAF